jgi:hypothetical protein
MRVCRRRLPKLPTSRPSIADRLVLRLCKHRYIDGLWIGTLSGAEAEPILRRVEEALALIKRYDPLQYVRVIRNLDRVWVNLSPDAPACFERSLQACVIDERFVLAATSTPEIIAKTIVHEATHARLERWGINYDEKERTRIEAVCLRRELAFAAKLPQGKPLQDEVTRAMEWCASNPDYFSNVSFHQRDTQGRVEALHYLGTPDWLIRAILKLMGIISTMRQFVRRITRSARQA